MGGERVCEITFPTGIRGVYSTFASKGVAEVQELQEFRSYRSYRSSDNSSDYTFYMAFNTIVCTPERNLLFFAIAKGNAAFIYKEVEFTKQ